MDQIKGNGLPYKAQQSRKENAKNDGYVTTCVRCRFGIFKDHEYEWAGTDGLVHINCNDPRLENAAT
jgi:hypothetical protein